MAKKKNTDEPMGYESHSWVIDRLGECQKADHDNREASRECSAFVNTRQGQWEEVWWNRCDGKPRYTFDLTTPVVDQIQQSMSRVDYDITVKPAAGDASKDVAATFDGLVRNIENISNAKEVFTYAGRSMVVKGLSGWRVVQKYVDGNSFDQDLVIQKIPNWIDSVWLGPHTEPDGSDAQYGFVMVSMTPTDFKKKYPDRSVSSSLSSDRTDSTYFYKHDCIMVGEFYYLKEVTRELVMMTSGAVHEVDDNFQKISDELALLGITEIARRKRTKMQVCIRQFDGSGWIGESKPTVFENWLPLVPMYANFEVLDDGKVIYYGAVEKLIDPQRVFNYSLSREIEEGALAPRAAYWMTAEQVAGYEADLAKMNVDNKPVRLFNVDPELPGPPIQSGGAQINAGLARISEAMQQIVGVSAGMFAANMGDNPNAQSGVAIGLLQDRGDAGANKYVLSREVAQRHTGRILVNAIPRVYLPGRQVRILQPDGSYNMETIGKEVPDQQTGQTVVLNDLTQGTYDVSCTSGPAFESRQSHTVQALTEVGAIDPSIIQMGGDVLLKNITAPGMDQIAERKRRQLFTQGLIPVDQMTEEEQAEYQQMQQQPQQPDAMMVAAMAEQKKAEADMLAQQNKQAEIQIKAQSEMANVQLKEKELQIKAFGEETRRYEADIARGVALADIKGKAAQAAKVLAEAEAQDIENDVASSGIMNIIEKIKGQIDGEAQRPDGQLG